MIATRRNPVRGTHADLFADKTATKLPSQATNLLGNPIAMIEVPAGHTPVVVPASTMSDDELEEFARVDFTNAEWAALPKRMRGNIEDSDEDSQERVNNLVAPFVKRWVWALDTGDKDFSWVEESFEMWLRDHSDDLWREMPDRQHDELVAHGARHGVDEDAVNQLITERMRDTNMYLFNPSDRDAPAGRPIWSEEIQADFYVEPSDYEELAEACTPDEVERALAKIAKETQHDVYLGLRDVFEPPRGFRYIQLNWDTGDTFPVYARWDDIVDSVIEDIDENATEIADDADAEGTPPPEDRVIYRWPDGFYVQDLVPSELGDEGRAMGMCVGRPDMGYGRAVRDGEIKILSLRRPNGKPLFTIEAKLTSRGKIYEIEQVKGKANRLPGFDYGKEGRGDVKRDEIGRVLEFVTQTLGLVPDNARDLRPGLNAVRELFVAGDPWAVKLADRLGLDEGWRVLPAPRQNPVPACPTHGAACGGGFCRPYRARR